MGTMKQKQATAMYAKGFTQKEIAHALGVHQSTVCRYLTRPSAKEKEDFYENSPYGAYITKNGERILFNRRYKPLTDKERWVEGVVAQEYFYNDSTGWKKRIYNSTNEIIIYKNKRND